MKLIDVIHDEGPSYVGICDDGTVCRLSNVGTPDRPVIQIDPFEEEDDIE